MNVAYKILPSVINGWLKMVTEKNNIEMANCTVVSADVTPVFINNNSERSEVICACCDKLRTELQKTLTELKSAQKIIELLLQMPNRTVSTGAHYLHHNENSTQLEPTKGNWLHVPSSHQKRDSKPEVQYTLPIPTIAKHYELLNNLNQPTNTALNQKLEVKVKTEVKKIRTKLSSLVIAMREYVRQKLLLTSTKISKSQAS
jgi:hypothetical protein